MPILVLGSGISPADNVAITGLTLEEGFEAFAGTTVGLSAALVNYGRTSASGTLTLYTGRPDRSGWEKRDPVQSVTVPPSLVTGQPKPHGPAARTSSTPFSPVIPSARSRSPG